MLKFNGILLKTEQFPNGETKFKDFFPDPYMEFKYRNDADLIKLMFAKKWYDESLTSTQNLNLFIWYMPYSRMDRKIDGDLFTLDYVCEFINWLDFNRIIVMEPHSDSTMELLVGATAIYPVKDWLPKIQEEIGFGENDHIVFPDKGAAARYNGNYYQNIITMEKTRNPTTGYIENMQFKDGYKVNEGSKCIIVDDLCSRGGTFAMAADILKKNGASEVYLACTHCEETIFDGKLLLDDSPIKKVYTSKSLMEKEHEKIHYMDIDVSDYLRRELL